MLRSSRYHTLLAQYRTIRIILAVIPELMNNSGQERDGRKTHRSLFPFHPECISYRVLLQKLHHAKRLTLRILNGDEYLSRALLNHQIHTVPPWDAAATHDLPGDVYSNLSLAFWDPTSWEVTRKMYCCSREAKPLAKRPTSCSAKLVGVPPAAASP